MVSGSFSTTETAFPLEMTQQSHSVLSDGFLDGRVFWWIGILLVQHTSVHRARWSDTNVPNAVGMLSPRRFYCLCVYVHGTSALYADRTRVPGIRIIANLVLSLMFWSPVLMY